MALAKRTLAQADLDAGRLVAPLQIATAVDFAYYLVHPKAKGRLPQVKAFVGWIEAEADGPRGGPAGHRQRRGDLTGGGTEDPVLRGSPAARTSG